MTMTLTLRALAALLAYPSGELIRHLADIRSALSSEGALARPERRRLEPLLAVLETEDLLDLQAAYSELFDRSRRLSLHLFEHVHGDSRERGQAMIDLAEQYAAAGILLDANELPDFIPVFLEYASCLEPREARSTLAEPAHVFAALAERLDDKGSPYAGIFAALVTLSRRRPGRDEVADLPSAEVQENEDSADIDREWEEAPVAFELSGAHAMGGPTGVVAKIRAGNRPTERGQAQ
jgi:nitrate reductase delta subunit